MQTLRAPPSSYLLSSKTTSSVSSFSPNRKNISDDNKKKIPKCIPMLDSETKERLEKITKNSSEFLTIMGNEPSIGLYHVQDHVRRKIPELVKIQRETNTITSKLHEMRVDIDYSLLTVQNLHELPTFQNVLNLMEECTILLQEMNCATKTPQRSISASPSQKNIQARTDEISSLSPTRRREKTYDGTTTRQPAKSVKSLFPSLTPKLINSNNEENKDNKDNEDNKEEEEKKEEEKEKEKEKEEEIKETLISTVDTTINKSLPKKVLSSGELQPKQFT